MMDNLKKLAVIFFYGPLLLVIGPLGFLAYCIYLAFMAGWAGGEVMEGRAFDFPSAFDPRNKSSASKKGGA